MRRAVRYLVAVGTAAVLAAPAGAGIVVFEEGDKKIELGGRIHLLYRQMDPDGGQSTDDLEFRRLRPFIAGSVTEDWYGKIEFDFGGAEDDDEVSLKDAFARYSGLRRHTLTIGNSKTPFSREFLTSSNNQQLIDRTFVGDHNFGSPDRQLGVRIDGWTESKKIGWSGAFGSEGLDPDSSRMDFDTPVNRDGDWNQGWVAAARIDLHPRGFLKFSQSDFRTDAWKYTVSAAAFTWSNDDDNNTYTDAAGMTTPAGITAGRADLDSATGFELSAALRGHGLSADVEYQVIDGETIDAAFSGGLYLNGETQLDKFALEVGYTLAEAPVEFMAGWESLDADNYATAYEITSFGVNWFWNEHKAKWQNVVRQLDSIGGVEGTDRTEYVSQLQFVF